MNQDEMLKWFAEHTTSRMTELVEKGLSCIEGHPNHHLELGIREAICMELGPHRDCGVEGKEAYRRRVELAVKVIEKVIPVWKDTWPNDRTLEPYLSNFYKLMTLQTGE